MKPTRDAGTGFAHHSPMVPMPRRRLGSTPFDVARISLGCVTFGREIDEEASFRVLDDALERGINLLDTAEAYGGGQAREGRRKAAGIEDVREASGEFHSSELILGRWLASRRCRDRIILQTKVTPPLGRQRILEAVDASLQRLQTSVIDLYLFHAPDPQTPIEQGLEAMAKCIRAGKVRHVGCSNFTAGQLQSALELAKGGLPKLEVVQSNYNLVVRDIEQSLLPLCRQRQVGVQTYSPLGAGFLTGKYDAAADLPAGSRFHIVPGHTRIYFHEEKFAVVRRLRALSQRVGIPAPRLAAAWVLKNQDVDTVLFGARTADHLDNAFAAAQLPFEPQWEAELLGRPA